VLEKAVRQGSLQRPPISRSVRHGPCLTAGSPSARHVERGIANEHDSAGAHFQQGARQKGGIGRWLAPFDVCRTDNGIDALDPRVTGAEGLEFGAGLARDDGCGDAGAWAEVQELLRVWENRFQVTVCREPGLGKTDAFSNGILARGHRIQDDHLLAQGKADHGHDALAGRTTSGVAFQGVSETCDDRSERIHKRSIQIEENRSDPSRGHGGSHTWTEYGRFGSPPAGTAAASRRISLKIAGCLPMMFLAKHRSGSANGRGQLGSIDRPRGGSHRPGGRSGSGGGGRLRGDSPSGASATRGSRPDGGGRRGRGGCGHGAECSAAGTGPQPRGEGPKDAEEVRHRPGGSRALGGHPTFGERAASASRSFRGRCGAGPRGRNERRFHGSGRGARRGLHPGGAVRRSRRCRRQQDGARRGRPDRSALGIAGRGASGVREGARINCHRRGQRRGLPYPGWGRGHDSG